MDKNIILVSGLLGTFYLCNSSLESLNRISLIEYEKNQRISLLSSAMLNASVFLLSTYYISFVINKAIKL